MGVSKPVIGRRKIKTVIHAPNCPNCGTAGQTVVATGQKTMLSMICPKCGQTWQSLSGLCPQCDEPNGYPSDGICRRCYKKAMKAG